MGLCTVPHDQVEHKPGATMTLVSRPRSSAAASVKLPTTCQADAIDSCLTPG